MVQNAVPPQRLIDVTELARKLHMSVRKVWNLRSEGVLPKPVPPIGERGTRWRESDIDRWIASMGQ
jgi:predicted DNA-binding transcriptional regulator AlpA